MDRNKSIRLLSIFVGLALISLACQSGPLARLFATATPTATLTPTPTSTPTATATPTPTATIPPTPKPAGVTVQIQADESVLFVDEDNKYQVVFPKTWFPILVSQDNRLVIPPESAQKYPKFINLAESLKEMDTEFLRMIALETENVYFQQSYPTFLSVMVEADIDPMLAAMGMSAVTAWVEDYPLRGAENLSWDVKVNAHGIEVGINEAVVQMTSASGTIPVRTRVLSFMAGDKLVLVQFFTPKALGQTLLPKTDGVIDTIELTNP
jgi:hypothetical protein